MRLYFDLIIYKFLSKVILIFLGGKSVLFSFCFGDVVPSEFVFVVFNEGYFFHLNAELSDFNQFADCLSDCNHLIVVCSYDTDVKSSSLHQRLEVFCHLFKTLRRNHAFSDIDENHLNLVLTKRYKK